MTGRDESPDTILDGKYQLLEMLGEGGSGRVYRALQQPLDRLVALKLLMPELGRDPAVRRRFAREARAVAGLNHPNVTIVYDFGVAEGETLYLAMEFIDGQSLRHHISEGLPTIPALMVVEQILSGLAHAHARGLVHRDLKPGNVLLSSVDDQLRAKIVDFGIVSVAGGGGELTSGRVVGTPRYMSPEQAQGEATLGPATDLYNVGLILYELAAGRHPFSAKTPEAMMLQHCTAPVPRPLPRPGFLLPHSLETIILRCLAKPPSKRFSSAAELRGALTEVRRSMEDSGRPVYLPVAPVVHGDAHGRITLIEGTPRVVSARPAKLAHALDVPLVGRTESKTLLLELSERLQRSERGTIIVLEGETGVGKTRLASWFKEQVVEAGTMRGVAGRYLRESETSLRGLREVLEQLFATRGLSNAEVSARVASQLVSWQLTDAPDAGLLIQLLRPPDKGTERRASDGLQESLVAALCRVLRAAAEQQPLLVLLDDVQWAGKQTADFITYMAGELASRKVPVLILLTLRSEELAANPDIEAAVTRLAVDQGDVFVRHRLRRLRDDELHLLIQHVLPAHGSLSSALIERCRGNPLYALHILRYLVDEQLIQHTETGSFVASGVKVAETVPPNLADLLLLRLHQLERRQSGWPVIAVLERAAVLGTRFAYDALLHLSAAEGLVDRAQLESVVDLLLDEGLLSQRPDTSDDVIEFEHGLVRDVLLERLAPRRSTRRLHELAAAAKREYYAGREDEVARELAAHYERSRQFADALRFSHRAGVADERQHLWASAAVAWRRFLRLYDRVRAKQRQALNLPSVAEVQLRLGLLLEGLGSYDAALDALRQLVPEDDAPLLDEPRVRGAIGLADIILKMGGHDRAQRLYERAFEAAEKLELTSARGAALLGLGRISWHHGFTKAATDNGRRALDASRQAGDRLGEADALWFLGDVGRLTGDLALAEERFADALLIYEECEEPRGRARCSYGLALTARAADDLERAEALYEAALEAFEPLGMRRGVGHCLNGLGEVARFRNRLGDAREHYRAAVDIYQSAGLETDAAVSLTNLGLVARDAGDLQAARDAMERGLRVANAAGYRYLTLGIAFNLAWIYALLGERRLCQELLDEHLDKALKHSLVDPDFARPLEGIAALLDAAGESREARRLFERAREMWEELRRERDASRVAALLR